MASPFKPYERDVVGALVRPHLPEEHLRAVLDDAELVSCQHTGVGYFLTVRHSSIPGSRIVCSQPAIDGRVDGLDCGFVVFLENGELVLECFSWGDALPEDIRERPVEVDAIA